MEVENKKNSISFVNGLNDTDPQPSEGSVFNVMFQQYERVVVESLITSFGLDMLLVKDQYGGDVDTVHNVRKIGYDSNMGYKNPENGKIYRERGLYDEASYHSGGAFRIKKHEAREKWQATGKDIADEYTGGRVGFYGHTKDVSSGRKAELDHIVECKHIHDDRGRVLSGLSGQELANNPENFAWTNKELNASMGSWSRQKNEKYRKEHGCDAPMEMLDARAYVAEHPDLDETTKKNLLERHERAKKTYDNLINRKYYTSKGFLLDTGKASLKLGATMGLRQALGLVFTEIWFSAKEEISKGAESLKLLFENIGNGVKKGLQIAKEKFSDIWQKFIEGSVAGVLSSLTTTICNIFFSTAKSMVKIIRQSWVSIKQAIQILFINPDGLLFGERIRAAAKVVATGASIVAGTLIFELIAKTPLGAIPVLGDILQTFCGTLVTGILSCTFLYFLDNSKCINHIVEKLNEIPCVEKMMEYYKMQGAMLDGYFAELVRIDVDAFEKEQKAYSSAADLLENCHSELDLHNALAKIYKEIGISCPWGDGDFNRFMEDESGELSFC